MSKEYWLSIGKGALVAMAGALLAYLGTVSETISDDSTTQGAMAGAVLAVLANIVRKFLEKPTLTVYDPPDEGKPSQPPIPTARLIAFALLIVPLSNLEAATPKAVITGPRTARCGDTITLDASDSDGETYEWDVDAIPFLAEDRDQPEVTDEGLKIRLPSYPGVEYIVTLVVAGIDELGKPRASITRWRVKVEGHAPAPAPGPSPGPAPNPGPSPEPQPGPAPEPGPQPIPPPPAPVPLSDIAKQVKGWTESINSPGNRRTEAEAIASSIDTVSSRLAAGVIAHTSARDLASKVAVELAASLNGKLGASQAAWSAGFDAPLGALVGQLFLGGQLNDSAAWAGFLREVSIGLRAAK